MTRKEQIKMLDDKIKTNERQYDLDRINAEISTDSSGDLPDALEKVKFEYSPLVKVFTDGLDKSDKQSRNFSKIKKH